MRSYRSMIRLTFEVLSPRIKPGTKFEWQVKRRHGLVCMVLSGVPLYAFFSWLAIKNRLATWARMTRWGAHQNCLFCGEPEKTWNNLFLHVFTLIQFGLKWLVLCSLVILILIGTQHWSCLQLKSIIDSLLFSCAWFFKLPFTTSGLSITRGYIMNHSNPLQNFGRDSQDDSQ